MRNIQFSEMEERKMNKPKYSNTITKLATVPQAEERYKLGRTKLMEIAEDNVKYSQ